MGPALAIKAAAGRRFALVTFGVSQVLIDVEPLVHMLRGDRVLHGFFHTFLGATLLVIPSALVGLALVRLAIARRFLGTAAGRWLDDLGEASVMAAVVGAVAGTWSHVFLDGLMHADLRPFAPWSDATPWLHVVPVGAIHLFCLLAGIVGAVAVAGSHRA